MQDPALGNDLVRKRCGQRRFAAYFVSGPDPHVAWHTQAEQAPIPGTGPSIGWFVRFGQHDEQIDVTALVRFAPGMRAKQNHLLRLVGRYQSARDLGKSSLGELHGENRSV